MKISQKKSILLSLLFFLIVSFVIIFSYFDLIPYEIILRENDIIKSKIQDNFFYYSLYCFFIFILIIVFLLPIGPFVLIIGYYFGIKYGLVIVLLGETIGSLLVFLYSRYLFKDYFLSIIENKFSFLKNQININAFNYVLLLRLIGGVPFPIQNIASSVLGMSSLKYIIATFIGIIPYAYIFISIGNGLNNINDFKEIGISILLQPAYSLPILTFLIIIILTIVYRTLHKVTK